jgi:hypothetical protein
MSKTPATILAPDVADFYTLHHGAFGAMNLLPNHLPTDARIQEIVRNVMTIDFAIGRAFGGPYIDYLRKFATATARLCGTVGLPEGERFAYQKHLSDLEAMDGTRLARLVPAAAADTMETINMFTPKQCNMSCRGCYAAAVPVLSRPYSDAITDGFYSGAVSVIRAARLHGARSVYTSGDGEPTIFPRFFDLLDEIRRSGMQWLFFTAGLIFSSEESARRAWQDARRHLQGPGRDRIEARLRRFSADGLPRPTVRALTAELAEYREHVQIYHSIWAADGAVNTAIRRPLDGHYEYVRVNARGTALELPSGLLTMMNEIFTGDLRGRMGIEMPVSNLSVGIAPAVASFAFDHGLRSYLEPTITTGRNKTGQLREAPPDRLKAVSLLLVRTLCGFRNVHQPTIKYHQHPAGNLFAASPGMGVDTNDLQSMGVLEPLVVGHSPDSFFRAVHSPLMAYANYVHITGCKCNDFAAALAADREKMAEQWRLINAVSGIENLSLAEVADRLNGTRS